VVLDLPRSRARRFAACLIIFAAQFGLFELGMRTWGSSEAAPAFQGLFSDDPATGYRLKPGARVRFKTAEFETDISINNSGLRDDDEIGAKAPDERRIVILGDSLVLSVQVPFSQTFGELLEKRLNATQSAYRYRVINAGVQGYGPVEELLLFKSIASRLQPDLVIQTLFVGNDAEEALNSVPRLGTERRTSVDALRQSTIVRLRRLVRRVMVLQVLRLRVVAAAQRFGWTARVPEPPLQSYAAVPAPRIAQGLAITRQVVEQIISEASHEGARTAVVLMPARFQVDDGDFGRLRDTVRDAGGQLVRDGATVRFGEALAGVNAPRFDPLPAMRAALPGPDLFFQQTVHLTPHGHEVVAEALEKFLRDTGLEPPPGR
jgi:lysophospholipase L1-like esterase